MDEQALIDSEREGTRTKKAMAQAELAARKVLWARAKVEWEEKHQALADAGGSKGGAGKPPLLRDIHLDNRLTMSASLPSSAEIMQNPQVGKGKQRRLSIDSLLGEKIDLGESEDDESDEVWLAHDESDE